MVLRVVCGLLETMATLWPRRALRRVDFPTFGRPTTATKPERYALVSLDISAFLPFSYLSRKTHPAKALPEWSPRFFLQDSLDRQQYLDQKTQPSLAGRHRKASPHQANRQPQLWPRISLILRKSP